jgi:hypothetical protein
MENADGVGSPGVGSAGIDQESGTELPYAAELGEGKGGRDALEARAQEDIAPERIADRLGKIGREEAEKLG